MKHPRQTEECRPRLPRHYQRNHYFYGKTLTVRDFEAEQRYFNEKRWLINRSVLGWGVVCGLHGSLDECGSLVIEPGLALDCHGREIWVPEPWRQSREQLRDRLLVAAEKAGKTKDELAAMRWVVCLRFSECHAEPVRIPASDCCGSDTEANWVRDSYRIEFVDAKKVCAPRRAELACPEEQMEPADCGKPGKPLHRILCEHVSRECPGCCDCQTECGEPCDCECLPLGELRFVYRVDDGEPDWELRFDPCAGRPLVYSNPLLFRLYQCEHGEPPPRIVRIGWEDWHDQHQQIDAERFWKRMPDGVPQDPRDYPFVVEFDRAMDPATFTDCSVKLAVVARGTRPWHRLRYEVPLSIETRTGESGCTVLAFCPRGKWLANENPFAKGSDDSVFRHHVRIEVELSGHLIRDLDGRLMDGEAPTRDQKTGELHYPSGEGAEGGSFVSCIHVRGAARNDTHQKTGD
jgi:hypothetical protein